MIRSLRITSGHGKIPAFITLVLLLIGGQFSIANEEIGRVRTVPLSESQVWVGQRIPFYIELMSPTIFSGTAHFDLPNIPGCIIMKSGGSPVVSSDNVDGETWSVQRHGFSIFAHRPGNFSVPPFSVRFSVPPEFGKPPEQQNLTTQTVSFETKMPPGAEGLSLIITTSSLEVTESWSPKISEGTIELEIGDALTRKIAIQAEDVPGMALPPIELPKPDGMSAYPDQAVITDKQKRGEFTGQRTESTTYVCEQPGEYQLPSILIPWWNPEGEILEKVVLPSINVVVVHPVTVAGEESQSANPDSSGRNYAWLLIPLSVLTVLVVLVVNYRERIMHWFTALKSRFEESEAACFAKVQSSCANDRPVETLNAITQWLEYHCGRAEVATIDTFLAQHADVPHLADELETMQLAAIGLKQSWSGRRLAKVLRAVRAENRKLKLVWPTSELPPLNP